MILQCGFYLGYRRDITVVLDSIDADIWFVPKNQPLFDGWVAMDDLPFYKAKGHPDIATVARLAWATVLTDASWALLRRSGLRLARR